jgi:hypothetical protein
MEGMNQGLLPLKVQAKFLRNIEKYAEKLTEDVDKTQAKLSMLLIETFDGDFTDLLASVQEEEADYEDAKYKPGNLNRRHSPISVVR